MGFPSGTTPPTLSSCILEFYANAYDSMAIFVDEAANKCWFGLPSTTTGSFALSGSSWRVYIKDSKFKL